jgi:long-chain acyl-CoA synthetase
MYLPLAVGATICPVIGCAGRDAPFDKPFSITGAAHKAKATTTVLVPELLRSWVDELESLGQNAPDTLRFVAVGGAPVAEGLMAAARRRGLPVRVGYGLTECCSVVCMNRPGEIGDGTVGHPIPGVHVGIHNGEIFVSGRTVMDGYVAEPDVAGAWPTGDLGSLDSDGRLIIKGRKDNIIVTSAGRNISPEWIEAMLATERSVGRCVIVDHDGALVAVLFPERPLAAGPAIFRSLLRDGTQAAPRYARPRKYMIMDGDETRELALLTPDGRPRRSEIRTMVARRSGSLLDA